MQDQHLKNTEPGSSERRYSFESQGDDLVNIKNNQSFTGKSGPEMGPASASSSNPSAIYSLESLSQTPKATTKIDGLESVHSLLSVMQHTSSSVPQLTAKDAEKLERQNSRKITQMIKEEKRKQSEKPREPKMLILGSSDSGKSTTMKQFRFLYGSGLTIEEKEEAKCIIYKNLLIACITLMCLADSNLASLTTTLEKDNSYPEDITTSSEDYSQSIAESFVSSIMDRRRSELQSLPVSARSIVNHHLVHKYNAIMEFGENSLKSTIKAIPSDLKLPIKRAFQEVAVLDALLRGTSFHKLPETTSYFIDPMRLDRILLDDYIPSNDDLLKCRHGTESISHYEISFNKRSIHIYDVAGVKGKRKAWLPYFDDCDSVLFVASLSCFDQNLSEDRTVNRMLDSLVLFEQTTSNPLLSKSDFILFLNKKDLFVQKAKMVKLQTYFPEYNGKEYCVSDYSDFLKKKFQNAFKSNRTLVTHITCATDTHAISVVIEAVVFTLLNNQLRSSGML